jgi:hypothetical protein
MKPPIFVLCPYCPRSARLVSGAAIYPHRPDLYTKKFWQCAPCDAWVGTHVNSMRHAPLGRLANAELRALKQKCHAIFDPVWKKGGIGRKEAYKRLAEKMGIPREECHIGKFDEDRCRLALEVLGKKEAA